MEIKLVVIQRESGAYNIGGRQKYRQQGKGC